MMLFLCLWLPGAVLTAGLLLGMFPPRRDSEGYQVMLVALTWPVWAAVGLYFRLADWVRYDLGDPNMPGWS